MPTRDDIEIIYDRGNDMLFTVDGQPGYFRWSWTGGALTSPWLQRGSRYEFGDTLIRAGRHEAIDQLLAGLNDGTFVGMDDDTLQVRAWNRIVQVTDTRLHMLRADLANQPETGKGARRRTLTQQIAQLEETRRVTMRRIHQAALEANQTLQLTS